MQNRRSRKAELQRLDDHALLERVIHREKDAFDVFHRRFRKLIIARIVRLGWCAGVRLQDADVADVVADTLLSMIEDDFRRLRLYRSDGGCSASTWIAIIAATTARVYLRKRRRPAPALLAEPAPPPVTPDAELLARQQREAMHHALRSFSERDRHFVELYYVRAMSCVAIAHEMGISLATIYSKKAKIKARLIAGARCGNAFWDYSKKTYNSIPNILIHNPATLTDSDVKHAIAVP